MIDWSSCPAVERDPERVSGAWVFRGTLFRGTRVPVAALFENLEDGALVSLEVLISTDLNLKYQQNLKARRIALIVLSTPSWPRIQRALPAVVRAVDAATPGSYKEIDIP